MVVNLCFESLVPSETGGILSITDELCQLPVQIPVVKPDPDRANPKVGISSMAFSADGRYLATKNGMCPFSS